MSDQVENVEVIEKPGLSEVNNIEIEEQEQSVRKDAPPAMEPATEVELTPEPDPFSVLEAKEPRWDQPEHLTISLKVLFYSFKDTYGWVPFTASPNDPAPHGRDIFARAKDGAYGVVAEPSTEALASSARNKLSALQAEANARVTTLTEEVATLQDAVDLEMATDEEAARLPVAKASLTAWKKYRVLLGRVEAQAGFPASIVWPEKPA